MPERTVERQVKRGRAAVRLARVFDNSPIAAVTGCRAPSSPRRPRPSRKTETA